MKKIPRILIAGTQSGVGKTSVTLGIVRALRRKGLRVQCFKVGPDYLDPTYLTLASGRPAYNLDGWMTDESYVRQLFARATVDADIAVVEGVMGLFDGAETRSAEGSTAEIARWLGAPVLLVINAHGMGRSAAALVHGFANFDPELKIRGVIANRTGSTRHAEWLKDALEGARLPELVGAIRRDAMPTLPSRHLGLVTASKESIPDSVFEDLSNAVEQAVDMDSVQRIAAHAEDLSVGDRAIESARPHARLGVAQDEAFHFYYQDNLDALAAAGCELVPFSPMRDFALPDALDGIYFGGGYPEEHAAALAGNAMMRAAIRQFAAAGGLVYGECGGLMYLSEALETLDETRYPMVGLLPVSVRMSPKRRMLGYSEVTLTCDTIWGRAGDVLRGHEFHYSDLTGPVPGWNRAYELRHRRTREVQQEGWQQGRVLASYVHLHFASSPHAVRSFVQHLQRNS